MHYMYSRWKRDEYSTIVGEIKYTVGYRYTACIAPTFIFAYWKQWHYTTQWKYNYIIWRNILWFIVSLFFCICQGYPGDWDTEEIDYDKDEDDYETMMKVTDIVGSLPYKERSSTGHEIKKMLLKCTFQNKHCSPV